MSLNDLVPNPIIGSGMPTPTVTSTDHPFNEAAARYEQVITEIHATKERESGHRTALGILRGEIEHLEASWVYVDNIYANCKNEKERDAVLVGMRRQSEEWQRLHAEVIVEEQGVQRAVRDRELSEDTRTLWKRRMEMCVATRQWEAAVER